MSIMHYCIIIDASKCTSVAPDLLKVTFKKLKYVEYLNLLLYKLIPNLVSRKQNLNNVHPFQNIF